MDSIEAFCNLKCPECIHETKEKTFFKNHALENHPLSHVLAIPMIRKNILMKTIRSFLLSLYLVSFSYFCFRNLKNCENGEI